MVTIEKISYKGWANCFRASNGAVELVMTGDVGPRIIRYGFPGGQNLFKEFEGQVGKSGETGWVARGGHRVWIAPEDPVKSYAPDNQPVEVHVADAEMEATGEVERVTGVQKKMTVRMSGTGTEVDVVHSLRNAGTAACDLAPWAPTMMAPGGYGIHGFPPRGTHPEMLAPSNPLVMWPFTNFSDPRWRISRKYLVLRQDPSHPVAQKAGSYNPRTWGAYLLNGELFVKRYEATAPSGAYPDMGCSFQMFTNADFLELETLGPLVRLAPGESVTHTERWTAHRGVKMESGSDDELDAVLSPLVG